MASCPSGDPKKYKCRNRLLRPYTRARVKRGCWSSNQGSSCTSSAPTVNTAHVINRINHVERNAPRLAKLAGLSPVLSLRLLAQEIEQQRDDLLRLLLLHPVPGAVEQLTADHAGADLLRAFESARGLVDAPVAHAADEDRWHVDRAPGK